MERDNLKSESINFQWNFYERAINNYSIIMRMLHFVEEEESLVNNMPRILVEGSIFDMCKILRNDNGIEREGFFHADAFHDLTDLDHLAGAVASVETEHKAFKGLYAFFFAFADLLADTDGVARADERKFLHEFLLDLLE